MENWLIIIIIFIIVLIFLLMEYFYRHTKKSQNLKIIYYLISCGELEQKVLQIFLQEPQKAFPLTKNAEITKLWLKLNIIIAQAKNSNNFILNPLIVKLIHKNKTLTKKYF